LSPAVIFTVRDNLTEIKQDLVVGQSVVINTATVHTYQSELPSSRVKRWKQEFWVELMTPHYFQMS